MENVTPAYNKKNRVYIIDAVRGFFILWMIVYHFHVDMDMFGILKTNILYSDAVQIVQRCGAAIFILTSGVSSRFSRNNLKRGIIMLAAGMAVTLATYILDQDYFVRFGILHFLGIAAILFWAYKPIGDKIPRIIQPFIYLSLYILTYIFIFPRTFDIDGLAFLGFRNTHYTSSDYFPIIPNIFIYLTGTWLGTYIAEGKFPEWFYGKKLIFLAFIGRNTMWVYLIHQPVFYGIAYLMYINR